MIRRAREKNAEGKLWQGSAITTSAGSPWISGLKGLSVVANVKQIRDAQGDLSDAPIVEGK